MSMFDNDGGPAFPQVETRYEGERGEYTQYVESVGGMSLRDYFAAKIAGVFANQWPAETDHEHIARRAYDFADAMLEARKQ